MTHWQRLRAVLVFIRDAIKWAVVVVAVPLGVLLIIAAVVIGAPFALLYALALSPFATIRWAFRKDESWIESWKVLANDLK